MNIHKINFLTDGGPWVIHDYPCPVNYCTSKTVYNMNKDVFEPSWAAQKDGWHLIKTDNWFKKKIYEIVFK